MAATRRKPAASARLRNGAHERIDEMADSVEALRDTAMQYVDEGRERADEMMHKFEDRVHDRPLMALVVAAGVGFLLGCFFSRR